MRDARRDPSFVEEISHPQAQLTSRVPGAGGPHMSFVGAQYGAGGVHGSGMHPGPGAPRPQLAR